MLMGEKSPNRNTSKTDSFRPGSVDLELGREKQVDTGIDRESDSTDQDESQDLGDYIALVGHLNVGLTSGRVSNKGGAGRGKCFFGSGRSLGLGRGLDPRSLSDL